MKNPTYIVMFFAIALLLVITFLLILAKVGTVTLVATPATDGDSTTVASPSGLEFIDHKLTNIRGCSNTQVLTWTEATDLWECNSRTQEYQYFLAGDVVDSGYQLPAYVLKQAVNYNSLTCNVSTAPTTTAVNVNIQENGTDIFSDIERVIIAAGTTTDASIAVTGAGVANDILALVIDDVDSGDTATNLTCQFVVTLK